MAREEDEPTPLPPALGRIPPPLPSHHYGDYAQYRPHLTHPEVTQIAPERTRVSFDIKLFVGMVAVLLTGAFAAGIGFQQMTFKLGSLERQMIDVVTKTDLSSMRNDLAAVLRKRMGSTTVRCPAPTKKETFVNCTLIFEGPE
jgi:hypothetical protein